ncbi:hypothetical protein NBRC116592_32100 [Colwellia sp. KU-HH00111]|uniref:Arm DNA-binding domain-containing protein n=1 Tax=Colwellia sp. KU-HH00111 TaxID=3127652 RepID=UPI0031094D3B
MSLSDNKLRNIKAPYTGKRELADRDGLTARISANAIITFNYRFRWQGKQQPIKIGRYSDIKLSEARIKSGVGSPLLVTDSNEKVMIALLKVNLSR